MEQGVHEVPMLVRVFLIVLFVGGCGAFFWGVSHSVTGKQPTPLGWTSFTLLALGLAAFLSVAPLTVFLAIVLATLLVTGGSSPSSSPCCGGRAKGSEIAIALMRPTDTHE